MIEIVTLEPDEYDRAKKVLNAARHPGFIGRELFFRCAKERGAVLAVLDGEDVGVLLVAKDKACALSVITRVQGRRVGTTLLAHLKPRWATVIAERVSWFEGAGYRPIGAMSVGKNGKHATQLMELSGEIATGEIAAPTTSRAAPAPDEEPIYTSIFTLVPERVMLRAETQTMIAMLDELMVEARKAGRFDAALKILTKAQQLIARGRH